MASDGGSPVLGYLLYQLNVTTGGEFVVYNGSSIPTITSFMSSGLYPGHFYQYRSRALNRVGLGDYSGYSPKIMAADKPGRPDMPWYISSSATTITLGWQDVADNGGTAITTYNIYADTGDLTDDTFNLIASTPDLKYTLDNTVLTQFISGDKYRFRITAVNVLGESIPSNEVRIALAALPAKPAAPVIVRSRCTLTSIYVTWVSPGADTQGFRLYMSEKGSGVFKKIYDGTMNKDTVFFNMTGLITGKAYSFYVEAINFNGVGQPSDETFAFACLAPWGLAVPQYVSSTKTSITISWRPPLLDGGCPVYTYALYLNGALTDDAAITKKPYLQIHTITGLTLTGQAHSIKIRAYNDIDYVESDALSVILAAVPNSPPTYPTQDYS